MTYKYLGVLMLKVHFFKNDSGAEPVREWLKNELSKDDRLIIGEDIKTVQINLPAIGMPLVKPMGNGLFEVRSNISDRRIARILFCYYSNEMVLLHGFIKKTEKTTKNDLELATKRKNTLLKKI
jgi:phage-related protein